MEGVADAVEAEVEARGERGLVLAQKFEARPGGGGERAAELADDEAVEPELEQSLVVTREELAALERGVARDEFVETRAARGLERERVAEETQTLFGPREEVRVPLDDLRVDQRCLGFQHRGSE